MSAGACIPANRGEETLSLITNGNSARSAIRAAPLSRCRVLSHYAGLSEEKRAAARIRELCRGDGRRARVLGAAFRVAHLISAARTGVLPATHFRSRGRKLMLVFEHRMVESRRRPRRQPLKQLARLNRARRLDRAEVRSKKPAFTARVRLQRRDLREPQGLQTFAPDRSVKPMFGHSRR